MRSGVPCFRERLPTQFRLLELGGPRGACEDKRKFAEHNFIVTEIFDLTKRSTASVNRKVKLSQAITITLLQGSRGEWWFDLDTIDYLVLLS
jgi:hypothetical protein